MRTLLLLVLFFPLLLSARENPFLPASAAEKAPEQSVAKIHSQRPESVPQAESEENNVSLPEEVTPAVAIEPTVPKIHPQRPSYNKEIINYSKARFVLRENSAYIETKDEVLRHFAIKNPPSIVIDFKASADFSSKRKELTTKPFIKLEVGSHHDYYRVVFRLDKKHRYKLETKRYGQVVTILD